jgi:hypothetical protein
MSFYSSFKDIPFERVARDIVPEVYKPVIEECVFDVAVSPSELHRYQDVVYKYLRDSIVGTNQVYGTIMEVEKIIEATPALFRAAKVGDPNPKGSVKISAKVARISQGCLLRGCEKPKITEEQATYVLDGFIIISVPFIDDQRVRNLVMEKDKIDLLVKDVSANIGEDKVYVIATPFIYDEIPPAKRAISFSKNEIVLKVKEVSISAKTSAEKLRFIDRFPITHDAERYVHGDVKKELKSVFEIKQNFDIITDAESSKLYVPIFRALSNMVDPLIFSVKNTDTNGFAHLLNLLIVYYKECYIYVPCALDPLAGVRYVVCQFFRGKAEVAKKLYDSLVKTENSRKDVYLHSLFSNGISENDEKIIMFHNVIFHRIQELEKMLPKEGTNEYKIRMERNSKLWKDNFGKA